MAHPTHPETTEPERKVEPRASFKRAGMVLGGIVLVLVVLVAAVASTAGYFAGRDDATATERQARSRTCSFNNQALNNEMEQALALAQAASNEVLLDIVDYGVESPEVAESRARLEDRQDDVKTAVEVLDLDTEKTLDIIERINNGEDVTCERPG